MRLAQTRTLGGIDESQQHLANAVPPLLASAVAWAIGEFWHNLLKDDQTDTMSNFSINRSAVIWLHMPCLGRVGL
jgi:hypothetical protein